MIQIIMVIMIITDGSITTVMIKSFITSVVSKLNKNDGTNNGILLQQRLHPPARMLPTMVIIIKIRITMPTINIPAPANTQHPTKYRAELNKT